MRPLVQPLAPFLQLQKPVSSVPQAWGGGGLSRSASPDAEVSHQRLLVNFPAGWSLTSARALGPKRALLSHRIGRRWPEECVTAGPRARAPRPQPRWPPGHLPHGPRPSQDQEARRGDTAFLRTDPPFPLLPLGTSAPHILSLERPGLSPGIGQGLVMSCPPRRPGTGLSDFLGVDFRVSHSSFPASSRIAHTAPPMMCPAIPAPPPPPQPRGPVHSLCPPGIWDLNPGLTGP